MGKRHFKGSSNSEEKKRRRDNAEKWRSIRGDENNRNPWVLENARMEAFYKAQKFVNGEDDWAAFMKHLQSPLPACFRIWPDYAFADELRKQMLEFVGKTLVLDGVEIRSAEQLHWYPGGYGYKLGTDRRSIRKLEGLNDLHKWMMQHTDNGNITRQEAVSMVPPLALNVSPHHRCLDMCAAPGSKTSQLLEIVNRSLVNPEDQQGIVVANDADTDRAYMLVHQCKRINSPLLVVSTHKGQNFPTITAPAADGSGKPTPFFDRVLCDVPCSGDGTLRKNPAIWAKWSTSGGMTLHPLQLMIAQRGLQLLQEGGLMVYSTCSMSPYENEAVVAELLRTAKGGLELVDAREFLPLFRCRKGLSHWLVLDDFYAVKNEARERKNKAKASTASATTSGGATAQGTPAAGQSGEQGETGNQNEEHAAEMDTAEPEPMEAEGAQNAPAAGENGARKPRDFSHIEDADLRRCLEMGMIHYPDFAAVPEHFQRKVRRSFFPPTEEEKQWMHLERCLRCVPQDEDTGGFFVATLRKVPRPSTASSAPDAATAAGTPEDGGAAAGAEASAEDCDEAACAAAAAEDGGDGDAPARPAAQGTARGNSNKGPVDFHQWDEEAFLRIKQFYGLLDTITREAFFIREDFALSGNPGATAAKSVYFIPAAVRALMQGDRDGRLKVVTAGVKVFEKKVLRSGDVDYRLLQDGIAYLEPYITKRKVSVTIQDFCNMLGGGLVSYSTLSAETLVRLNAIPSGVVIAIYEYRPQDVLPAGAAAATADEAQQATSNTAAVSAPAAGVHKFYAICWKGNSRAINVMCGKVEIESIKHQLAALGVLRPKINAVRIDALVGSEGASAEAVDAEQAEQVVEEAAVGNDEA